MDKKILIPIFVMVFLALSVSATTDTFDITDFENGNIFWHSYLSDLNDSSGFTSQGGIAYYDFKTGDSDDQWGSNDGTESGSPVYTNEGLEFDGVDDVVIN